MSLRVTIDLIPLGIEGRKRTTGVIEIENDGTGTNARGNYEVRAEGETVGGWDTFFAGRVEGVQRGDYLRLVAGALQAITEEAHDEKA